MNSFIKNAKPFKNSYSTSNTMPTINKPQSSDKLSMVNRLPISPLLMTYPKYKKSICSSISKGIIKVYGVNSYRGLVKKYNEDTVSIVLNISKPKKYKGYWPQNVSTFCLFDGHSGNCCSNFLKEHFNAYFVRSSYFPENIENAIYDTFARLENDFISRIAIGSDGSLKDKSGSCALVTIIVDDFIYIANIGDSRAVISLNNGNEVIQATNDHNPQAQSEKKRIIDNEGVIYKVNSFNVLYRIIPGNLSVSRTIGDVTSKVPFLGGKLGVIISTPSIVKFKNDKEIDFILMGNHGIFSKVENEDLIKGIWSTFDYNESLGKNVNEQGGICADMALKLAMYHKSKDNVSAIIIGFDNFERQYKSNSSQFHLNAKTIEK